MKNLYKPGLIIFLVVTFLFSTCLIPSDTHARVWICREVSFAEPGEDPNWIIANNIDSSSKNVSATQSNPMETECISTWILYSKIIFSQFLNFLL
jgi:hypothetical protein